MQPLLTLQRPHLQTKLITDIPPVKMQKKNTFFTLCYGEILFFCYKILCDRCNVNTTATTPQTMSITNTSREKIEKKSTLSTLIAVEKADILFALLLWSL